MQSFARVMLVCGFVAIYLLIPVPGSAQSLTVLYNFLSGEQSPGILLQGTDGNLYGQASGFLLTNDTCAPGSCGTVFDMNMAGLATTLHSFGYADGGMPSGLIQGSDGNFYGTTALGGNGTGCFPYDNSCGTIFELTPQGVLTTLYDFSNYGNPGGLLQATDGNFYGIVGNVCSPPSCSPTYGGIFKFTLPGTVTVLYGFCSQTDCSDGLTPNLILQADDGNLYGLTGSGGAGGVGTVFKLALDGTFTLLYTFCVQISPCPDGIDPVSLIQGTDGNFYGTTHGGGANYAGTVFKMTPAGTLTTLYSFCSQTNCDDGAYPDGGILQASDGNLYGTTLHGGTGTACPTAGSSGCGTLYDINTSGALNTLYNFCSQPNCADGSGPAIGESLVQASDRVLYGTTSLGGVNNTGVFFSFSAGLNGSAASTTSLALAPSTIGVGLTQPIVMTANVSSQSSTGMPEGTVGFYIGSTYLGTAVLSNGIGTVSYDPSTLAVNTYQISANYNGDATFAPSSSPTQVLMVSSLPVAALPTFSPASGSYGSIQTVGISDTIDGATIYYTTDGTTPTTSSAVYSQPIAVKSTITIRAIASATGYSNSGVATATFTITLAPDYQVSVNPTTLTITAGRSGTATFVVTSVNGFNSQVSFACSGLPSEATCSFSPSAVTLSNGNPITSTMTVTTTAASSSARLTPELYGLRAMYALWMPSWGVVFIMASRGRKGRNDRRIPAILFGIIMLLGMSSCGNNSNKLGNPGTPIGASTITVTASASGTGATSHSVALEITVIQ